MKKIVTEQFVNLTFHVQGGNLIETMNKLQAWLKKVEHDLDLCLTNTKRLGDYTIQMELNQDEAAQVISEVRAFCQEQGIEMDAQELYSLFLKSDSLTLKRKCYRGLFTSADVAKKTLLDRAMKPFKEGPNVVLYTIVGPDNVVAEGHFNVAAP